MNVIISQLSGQFLVSDYFRSTSLHQRHHDTAFDKYSGDYCNCLLLICLNEVLEVAVVEILCNTPRLSHRLQELSIILT
jgi:hypothetical protein